MHEPNPLLSDALEIRLGLASPTSLSDRDIRIPAVGSSAEALHAGGYETVAIVTNAYLHPVGGFARGFDRYTLLEEPLNTLPSLTILRRATLLLPRAYQPASQVRRELAGFLSRRRSPARPLFLRLHLMEPHSPLNRHPELPSEPALDLPPGEQRYRDEVQFAAREIVTMKGMLGSLWEDGLAILTADHGEMSERDGHSEERQGTDRIIGHGHAFFEELVRVPLLIRPPLDLEASRHSRVLVSTLDLWPTMRAAAGLFQPSSDAPRSGRNLLPWLASEPRYDDPRPWALSSANYTGPPRIAMLRGHSKLIHGLDGRSPDLLSDLAGDPGEHRNLASVDPDQLAADLETLSTALASLTPRAELETVAVDAGMKRKLRSLGYNRGPVSGQKPSLAPSRQLRTDLPKPGARRSQVDSTACSDTRLERRLSACGGNRCFPFSCVRRSAPVWPRPMTPRRRSASCATVRRPARRRSRTLPGSKGTGLPWGLAA